MKLPREKQGSGRPASESTPRALTAGTRNPTTSQGQSQQPTAEAARGPLQGERMEETRSIRTMKYYSALKRKARATQG